jgi:hypothetical protein
VGTFLIIEGIADKVGKDARCLPNRIDFFLRGINELNPTAFLKAVNLQYFIILRAKIDREHWRPLLNDYYMTKMKVKEQKYRETSQNIRQAILI